jgi:hypothetical protein
VLLNAMSAEYSAFQVPPRKWIELAANDYWPAPKVIPFSISGVTLDTDRCQNDRFAQVRVLTDPQIFSVRASRRATSETNLFLRFRVELTHPDELTLFTPEFCLRSEDRGKLFQWVSCGETPLPQ